MALEALKRPCHVTLYSDSQYLVNAFNQNWVAGWLKRGWKNAQKQPVKNVDLWKRMLKAKEPHDVTFVWVKGPCGAPRERALRCAGNLRGRRPVAPSGGRGLPQLGDGARRREEPGLAGAGRGGNPVSPHLSVLHVCR